MKGFYTFPAAFVAMGAFAAIAYAAGEDTMQRAAALVEERGEVTEAEGLEAWDRIHAVVSHPRCANCHTDDKNIPMWSGPEYSEARPHGMNINAGESRIGAETLLCSSCHMTSTRPPNSNPNAAPHAGIPWQLAPVEFLWFNVTGPEICRQMRDSERNGGRDAVGVVEHLLHDEELEGFIQWGWKPGGDRETPPGTYEDHLNDTVLWAAAGMPCPD